MQRYVTPLGLVLAAVAVVGWLVLLMGREPTPWAVLEARQAANAGPRYDANTADGMPLFGREIGGCYRDGRLALAFIRLNLPAVMITMFAYGVIGITPLPVRASSFLTGLLVIVLSGVQWLLIARAFAWTAGRFGGRRLV